MWTTEMLSLGVLGVLWHPQILADQLTLSQLGGQIMPTKLLLAPTDFKTFRRPWTIIGSESEPNTRTSSSTNQVSFSILQTQKVIYNQGPAEPKGMGEFVSTPTPTDFVWIMSKTSSIKSPCFTDFGTFWHIPITPILKIQWVSLNMFICRPKSFQFFIPFKNSTTHIA